MTLLLSFRSSVCLPLYDSNFDLGKDQVLRSMSLKVESCSTFPAYVILMSCDTILVELHVLYNYILYRLTHSLYCYLMIASCVLLPVKLLYQL